MFKIRVIFLDICNMFFTYLNNRVLVTFENTLRNYDLLSVFYFLDLVITDRFNQNSLYVPALFTFKNVGCFLLNSLWAL